MKTITDFIDAGGIVDESLVRAVIKQIGGWEEFITAAPQVCEHGADTGWNGFIYYSETVAFADFWLPPILDLAADIAYEIGGNQYSIIAGFNCLKDLQLSEGDAAAAIHNKASDDHLQVMNALAWFALEEVCRSYCDMVEA